MSAALACAWAKNQCAETIVPKTIVPKTIIPKTIAI